MSSVIRTKGGHRRWVVRRGGRLRRWRVESRSTHGSWVSHLTTRRFLCVWHCYEGVAHVFDSPTTLLLSGNKINSMLSSSRVQISELHRLNKPAQWKLCFYDMMFRDAHFGMSDKLLQPNMERFGSGRSGNIHRCKEATLCLHSVCVQDDSALRWFSFY